MRVSIGAAIVALVCGVGCGDDDGVAPLPPVTDPLEWIDPTIGTGGLGFGHGSAFVGATAPHGLVKVAPDTKGPNGTINFLHYSGYWAGDDTIQGFSHLHLHGTGATDYGVVSIMPIAALDGATSVIDHAQKFAKADEHARVGLYEVTLADGTRCEMTATPHAAHHRFTFAPGGGRQVLVDLDKHLNGGTIDAAEVTLDASARRVHGHLHHLGGMSGAFGGYDVWFELVTKDAWVAAQAWSSGMLPADVASASGTGVGFVLDLGAGDAPVEVQVGISLVSAAGAANNLAAEMPGFDFDGERAATEDAWRALTGAVLVEGGTAKERRIFYTSLYHAFLMPSWVGDVDGSYRIDDAPVETVAGARQLSDFSLWDTYRTLHPLYALIAPGSAKDSVASLVRFAKTAGFFPRWAIATGEAGTMLGASAEVVVADAVVKGIDVEDGEAAYAILRAAAMDATPPAGGRGGRDALEEYAALGYVPSSHGRSVSMTTEYAHDDFALAELAAALGHDADATALHARAHGWRLLYDADVGFLRGKRADGQWASSDFDASDFSDDYAEANAWQSLWMVGVHDAEGFAGLVGGRAAAVTRLLEFFTSSKMDWDATIDDTGAAALPRPYYWHGNEPDINAAWMFAQLGRPDLTQEWVRWVADTQYGDGVDGVAGNDDGGTMGSWYVWAALGLYPVAGSDRYVIGAPRFPRASVKVAGGQTLVIEAAGVSEKKKYVQSVTLNGAPVEKPELTHAQLLGGGALVFVMGEKGSSWGAD